MLFASNDLIVQEGGYNNSNSNSNQTAGRKRRARGTRRRRRRTMTVGGRRKYRKARKM